MRTALNRPGFYPGTIAARPVARELNSEMRLISADGRWSLVRPLHTVEHYLECFANTHTPRPGILTSSKVGANIDAIYLTELESYTPTAPWKEIIDPESLGTARRYFANPAEPNKAESLGQRQTVL